MTDAKILASRAVQDIDRVIDQVNLTNEAIDKRSLDAIIASHEIETMELACIRRWAPLGTTHRDAAERVYDRFYESPSEDKRSELLTRPLRGILRALKTDYAAGRMVTVTELVRAETFSDFLEMADQLLADSYKDAAATLVGGVLENHLRSLATKAYVTVVKTDGKLVHAEQLNQDLYARKIYSQLDRKNVTAWLGLRNEAAHGQYQNYNIDQVKGMLDGVREFVARTLGDRA